MLLVLVVLCLSAAGVEAKSDPKGNGLADLPPQARDAVAEAHGEKPHVDVPIQARDIVAAESRGEKTTGPVRAHGFVAEERGEMTTGPVHGRDEAPRRMDPPGRIVSDENRAQPEAASTRAHPAADRVEGGQVQAPLALPEAEPIPVAVPTIQSGGAGGAGPQALASDPLESGRSWIGGLLNATQGSRDGDVQAQTTSAPLLSTSTMMLVFGIAVGASTSVVGLRRIARRAPEFSAPRKVPAASRPALSALVERVARAPMDGAACFQLAIELLGLGIQQDGLRLLDRSIRINPLLIVQLLQEPQYASIRQSAPVKRLLADVKRDYDRRLLTGYA